MGGHGQVYGPRTITQVYQVSVPAALLRKVGLGKHSEVSFAVSLEDPMTICMFAADRAQVQ
jgi:bifunctional DNA-binding transcriptional regulator/antitoxin component of YhaV-PrlF toxin-antitoxin module